MSDVEIVDKRKQKDFKNISFLKFNKNCFKVKPISLDIYNQSILDESMMMCFVGGFRNAKNLESKKINNIKAMKGYYSEIYDITTKASEILNSQAIFHKFM